MNNELITAYVDNEIKDENLLNQITEKIQSDFNLKYEFEVQSLCKNIVKQKLPPVKAPDYLKQRILSEIKPRESSFKKKTNFLLNLIARPSFSFATAIVIVASIILITVNRFENKLPPDVDLASLESDNMFLQAINNYSSILKGELKPQYITDDSKEICNFFYKSGVNYSTVVPEFKEWKLLGAVVSEDKGTKLAHHVYVGSKNQIIYVFQVDEDYINKVVKLDTDLLNYLDLGNCFSKEYNNNLVLFTKVNHNIFAVISNDDFDFVKNNFCNLN
jgi:hypothetical protein